MAASPAITSFDDALRLGTSACLLGELVRYDGGHRRSEAVVNLDPRCVRVESVCPEAEAGLGIPRPPMHFAVTDEGPRLLRIEDGYDLTSQMLIFVDERVSRLGLAGLDGFILKARSPSCGFGSTPAYLKDGTEHPERGSGLFASKLRQRDALLPIVEDEAFAEETQRDVFLEQAFFRSRFRAAIHGPDTPSALATFHHRHYPQYLAHQGFDAGVLDGLLEVAMSRGGFAIADYALQVFEVIAAPLCGSGRGIPRDPGPAERQLRTVLP